MFKTRQFWIGVLSGIIAPPVAFYFYNVATYKIWNQETLIRMYFQMGLGSAILSLMLVANLAVFFLYIWRNKDTHAYGVLFISLLYAMIGFYMKLFMNGLNIYH